MHYSRRPLIRIAQLYVGSLGHSLVSGSLVSGQWIRSVGLEQDTALLAQLRAQSAT